MISRESVPLKADGFFVCGRENLQLRLSTFFYSHLNYNCSSLYDKKIFQC